MVFLFCGRGLNFFQPLEVPILKQHMDTLIIFKREGNCFKYLLLVKYMKALS